MRKVLGTLVIAFMFILVGCQSGDTTAPVITVDPNFTPVQTLGGMIQMPNATCVDDVDATCDVHVTLPTNWTDDLQPGTYVFTLIAEDRAGNVATETVTLTLNQKKRNSMHGISFYFVIIVPACKLNAA